MNIEKKEKPDFQTLCEAFTKLYDADEVYNFLRDICTLSEMSAMAERLEVAELIESGVSYRAICKNTGASTATITRVAHWLHHGEGGYHSVLARLKN